jgi:hypothetical protein
MQYTGRVNNNVANNSSNVSNNTKISIFTFGGDSMVTLPNEVTAKFPLPTSCQLHHDKISKPSRWSCAPNDKQLHHNIDIAHPTSIGFDPLEFHRKNVTQSSSSSSLSSSSESSSESLPPLTSTRRNVPSSPWLSPLQVFMQELILASTELDGLMAMPSIVVVEDRSKLLVKSPQQQQPEQNDIPALQESIHSTDLAEGEYDVHLDDYDDDDDDVIPPLMDFSRVMRSFI